jgi:hypothetical protein
VSRLASRNRLLRERIEEMCQQSAQNGDASLQSVRTAGVLLEHYVSVLEAENRLQGKKAENTAHYYQHERGIYDGVASCLEAVADRSGVPSFRESVEDVADQLRKADPVHEDPTRFPNVVQALVYLIGALVIASR